MVDFKQNLIENAQLKDIESLVIHSGDLCTFTANYTGAETHYPKKWLDKNCNGFSVRFSIGQITSFKSNQKEMTGLQPSKVDFVNDGVVVTLFARKSIFEVEILGRVEILGITGAIFV